MKYKLIARISLSLLMARWRQTLVAAVGVTFSITMFIALLSFMSGLNILLDGLILNRTPHVLLFNEIKPSEHQPIEKSVSFKGFQNFIRSIKPKRKRAEITNSGAIISALNKDERVLGVAPKITAQVFYNVGLVDLTGIINGIDVEEENKLFLFKDYVVSGNFMDLKNIPNSIILGKGVAEKMLVQIGDMIQITTSRGEQVKLRVVGNFQSGIRELDNVQSYCSINTTQKCLGSLPILLRIFR
jgi:lipoprotein-releasing system permease protein